MPCAVKPFTIALVQMRCEPDPQANLDKAVARLRQAAAAGAQIVCLHELFRTPYFCQREDPGLFDLAEPIPGPTSECLAAVARKRTWPLWPRCSSGAPPASITTRPLVLDADGSLLGHAIARCTSRTIRSTSRSIISRPATWVSASSTRAAGRVGVLVCWDQWYPEAARLTALRGRRCALLPHGDRLASRRKGGVRRGAARRLARLIQRSHAIANGVYVAAVNRVGHEGPAGGGLEFWGASFVSDPFGRVLRRAGHDREELLLVECDPQHLENVRRNWPFLRDRRIDAYGAIGRRFLDADV